MHRRPSVASVGPLGPGARRLVILSVTGLSVAGAWAAGACSHESRRGLSRQKFVDVYVQLIQARIDARGDSTAYAAKRDRVFMLAHVSAADLRDYVREGARDPTDLRDAWQAIAARVDTLYGGVTTGPPPGLREAFRTRTSADSAGTPRARAGADAARAPVAPAGNAARVEPNRIPALRSTPGAFVGGARTAGDSSRAAGTPAADSLLAPTAVGGLPPGASPELRARADSAAAAARAADSLLRSQQRGTPARASAPTTAPRQTAGAPPAPGAAFGPAPVLGSAPAPAPVTAPAPSPIPPPLPAAVPATSPAGADSTGR